MNETRISEDGNIDALKAVIDKEIEDIKNIKVGA